MERNLCLHWPSLVEEAIKRRKELKFTQERLALLCEISKPTLVNFEQGKTSISLEKALKILDMLGLVDKRP